MVYHEDREKVQTLLHKNLVVEAGAGTGKTTLLITRLCTAVLAQGIAVEKMVALTFTEKAAAEIKTRLIMQLHSVLAELDAPEQTRLVRLLTEFFSIRKDLIRSRAEAALARLDHAHIGTIHSFCADILKTFPLEAGLAPQAEIDSGQKAQHVFDAHWHTFLDRELGVQAPRAEQWKRVLPEISLEDLKAFAQELCSGKIASYNYFSHADLLAALCEEKAKQAAAWSTAFLGGAKSPRNCEKALSWAAVSLRRSALFLRKQEFPSAPENDPPAFPTEAVKGWEPEIFEQARALVAFAKKLVVEKQQCFLDAFELVHPIVEQIRNDYLQEGILSFDDLIVKTRDLLQKDLYVRRLLKEKFDLLFIDEFQDTDPVQGELLLLLAEEKTGSAPRWQEVRLAPGKLFVVGDPKQSVYRFRGADITAYELFTDLILKQGGEKCFLQQNFRCAPDIVTVANEVCRRAMVQETSFQPAYVPIFAAKPNRGQAVQWLFILPPDKIVQADDYRHNQAEQIARWIEAHVGKDVLANGKKLTYGDIAILSRASTTAWPYTDALRRHGIAFNIEKDKDYYRKQEINDFLNLLQVIADPVNQTALVGVLRSPLGGFSDEAIYQIVKRGELNLKAKTQDPALRACYQLLQSFVQKAGRTPLKDLLHEILDRTFFPEVCAAAYDGERSLAVLQRFVRLAEGYAAQNPTSLGQFLAELRERLFEKPELLDEGIKDDIKDAVSVMSIHKSKGLEFPVVILADLSKREGGTSSKPTGHIFSWQYNMHGLRAGKICDANLAFLEEEQKKHARCEEIRILYVALTRAREKMLLVADPRKGADKAAGAFSAAGLFPTGKEKMIESEEVQIPVQSFPYVEPDSFIYQQTPVPVSGVDSGTVIAWKQAAAVRLARYEQIKRETVLSPSEQVQESASLSPQQRIGAEVGTVCHRALEYLLTHPDGELRQAVAYAALGESTSQAHALELLQPFVKTPLWKQINQSRVLATEMPFTLQTQQGAVSGIVDAVLQQEDGCLWVVDYKTDQVENKNTKGLLEKYRPQLTVYRQALRQLFPGTKIRVSAVFIRAFAAEDL